MQDSQREIENKKELKLSQEFKAIVFFKVGPSDFIHSNSILPLAQKTAFSPVHDCVFSKSITPARCHSTPALLERSQSETDGHGDFFTAPSHWSLPFS